jgi:hypothetical protein
VTDENTVSVPDFVILPTLSKKQLSVNPFDGKPAIRRVKVRLNTTTYPEPGVTELLRHAESEEQLDALLAGAAEVPEASASTRRKWRKVAEQVRGALRARALEVKLVLP